MTAARSTALESQYRTNVPAPPAQNMKNQVPVMSRSTEHVRPADPRGITTKFSRGPSRRSAAGLSLILLAGLTSCTSDLEPATDNVARQRADIIEECFPTLYDRVDELLELADLWRLNQSTSSGDPTGLTWSEETNGTLTIAMTVDNATLNVTLSFYNPTGALQNLDLSAATTLNEAVDAAATELRTNFTTGNPFMVADWSFSGAGLTASGALTGEIGGTGADNQLLSLSTTSATPSGGLPPAQAGTIGIAGAAPCTLEFSFTNLRTDANTNQGYPIGTVTFEVIDDDAATGAESQSTATAVFDDMATVTITVSGVPGMFTYNLDTKVIGYQP